MMRALPQVLTWGTATAAISSAVWLASTVPEGVVCVRALAGTGDRAAAAPAAPIHPLRLAPPPRPATPDPTRHDALAHH